MSNSAQWGAMAERVKQGRAAMKAADEAEKARKAQAEAEKEARAARFLGDQRVIAKAETDLANARAAAQGAEAKAQSFEPQPQAAAAAPQQGGPAGVADSIRQRGARDIEAGVQLLTEADRRIQVRTRNPTHGAVQGFTDAMGGNPALPVGRRGIFQPGAAGMRAPVVLSPQGQPIAVEVPPEAAPVEAVPQGAPLAQAVPAGAAPGIVPGQAPQPIPAEAAPLEEDVALQQAQDAGTAFDFTDEADVVTAAEPEPAANDGILQRQLDAEERLAQARVDTATEQAVQLQDASNAAREALAAEEQAQQEHAERLQQRLTASEEATRSVETLTAKAQEMAAIDPRRAWANAGAGRKIGFAIQIALSSFGGRANPLAPLQDWIAQDVDAQVQGAKKAQQDIEGARGVAMDSANLLEQAREITSDENIARTMVEAARLQQVKSQFEAGMAAAGLQQLSAEQQAQLTQIEELIAEKNMAIQAKAATNPEFFFKAVRAHSPGQREAMQTLGRGLLKSGLEAPQTAEEQEAKIELRGIDAQMKGLEDQRAAAAKRNDKIAEAAYRFGKDAAPAMQVIGSIDVLLEQDDIAGFGFTAGPTLGNEANNVEAQLDTVVESLARLQSQGAVTEEEFARFSGMLRGGTTFGGEKRLRQNLQRVKAFVQMKVDAMERGMSREERAYYNRNVRSADFSARFSGGEGEGVVVED